MRALRRAVAVIGIGALCVLPGCGGGSTAPSGPPGPDPATLTPADAPVYLDAVVRPEGDQATAVNGALSKLLATDDPGGFIVDQLDNAFAQGKTGITYEDDVAPWLGQRAGIFFETLTANPDGAALVQTTDPAATQDAIDKAAAADKTPEHHHTYKGVDYQVDTKDNAVGIDGDFLIAGSEQGLHDAVDASQGSSLADDSGFQSQSDAAPPDRVGFAYADPQAIVAALQKQGSLDQAQLQALTPQVKATLSQPASASLSATSDQVSLETSTAAGSQPAPTESSLLDDLPADSWLAFASANGGSSFAQGLGSVPPAGQAQLRRALGVDLGSELSDWAGDIGGFVSGTSVLGIGGALIVETTDEQASAQALGELQAALSRQPGLSVQDVTTAGEQGFSVSPAGSPIQLQIVQKDGKVVAGVGSDSVDEALSPTSSLSDSDAFGSARDALGSDFVPVTYLGFVPLFSLVNTIPQASADPGYEQAKPYLDHLDYVIIGAQRDGDRSLGKLVLGLRESSAQGSATSGSTSTSAAAVTP
jgi:hypothetical protein